MELQKEYTWEYRTKTLEMQNENLDNEKGVLLGCKRVRFGLQKESF